MHALYNCVAYCPKSCAKTFDKIDIRLTHENDMRREQLVYRSSAVAATALFGGLAFAATYYRFFFHSGGTFPWLEFWSTLSMIFGGIVRPSSKLLREFRLAAS
jgi:hypothetical protein